MKLKMITLSLGLLLPLAAKAQVGVSKAKPKAYIVADAHFDTNWNWTIQTSINRYLLNTMTQNLFLMNKYPDYIFNFESADKYAWMKEYYPDLFAQVKARVKEGRWHVAGASWEASDAVIASPEGFLRNILLGQKFYQDEFGTQCTDIFLPDCFGFPYTLPTIANHCGLIGFSTQKMGWRHKPFYTNGKKTPFDAGLWEGVDGAKIMMVPDAKAYGTRWPDKDLSQNKELLKMAQDNPLNFVYHYYGTGDMGGSPTIESVRAVEKGIKGDGPLQIISATSDQLFKDYLPYDQHPELPVFKGELLMDVHGTGCYTSEAAMKLYNRKNELLGDASERASVIANWMVDAHYPQQRITNSWKRFVWHTFHDDITGTSLPEVYQNSWNDELISQKEFAQVLTNAVGNITTALNTDVKGIPLVIHNTISQPVKDVVTVSVPFAKDPTSISVFDDKGTQVASQLLSYTDGKATILVSANVPSMSFVVYDVRAGGSPSKSSLVTTSNSIENSIYKVTLNTTGDISSILDKRNGKELVAQGKAIRLALFTQDESYEWPAWEILKKTIDADPISITDGVKISVAEKGSLRSALCVERKYKGSTFKQYIRLTDGGQDDRIDIVNDINWQTTNALLKAEFPLNVSNPKATYDLGLGSIQRGNNTDIAYEVPAQDWADLTATNNEYGVSILNNCKYGWDKPNDNTIRLTLFHTPKTKGGYKYQSKQDFGNHHFTYSIVGHTGSYVDAKTVLKAEVLNQSMRAFVAPKNKGTLGRSFSFLNINTDQVLVKALKKAENSDDYVIRLYETTGKDANVQLSFAGNVVDAKELNGVEKEIGNVNFSGKNLNFKMTPFSIKTFRVRLSKSGIKAIDPVSKPIDLNYDVKTATYNHFCQEANFDGKGNSFAAELLPATITSDNVVFNLGDPAIKNGLRCKGDTIAIPQGFDKLYLLAASSYGDTKGTFLVDRKSVDITVPYFSGYIGQWEHTGYTTGFCKPQNIAYIGTHIHTSVGNQNVAYTFGYMFKFEIDLPKGTKQVVLPRNTKIVLFAATVANNINDKLIPATNLVTTDLKTNNLSVSEFSRFNLLEGKPIIGKSGENGSESAMNAIDGNPSSKWCEVSNNVPKYIEVDLQKEETIKAWYVLHAGMEDLSYVSKDFQLLVKSNINDPWKTVDEVTDNKANETDRVLSAPVKARYVRLNLTKPDQDESGVARIYQFEVY